MEGGESSAVVAPTFKARRGSGGAIYDQYLNIKNNALSNENGGFPAKKSTEISNSTDEQELEAGEVVSTEENDAACANGPSGLGVSAVSADGKRESEVEPQAQLQPQPQQASADTPQPEASAPAVEDNTQLTAVGTVCASAAAPTVDTPAAASTIVDAPPVAAPMSPSAAAFERARAPALSNPSSPSHSPPNEQYAAMRVGAPIRMTNNGRDMTSPRLGEPRSPRMGGPGRPMSPRMMGGLPGPPGPPRGRSRSRDRNGDMNGGGHLEAPTAHAVDLVADQVALPEMALAEDLAVLLVMDLVVDRVVHLEVVLMDDLAARLVVTSTEGPVARLVVDLAVHLVVDPVVRLVEASMEDLAARLVEVSMEDLAVHLVVDPVVRLVEVSMEDPVVRREMDLVVDAVAPDATDSTVLLVLHPAMISGVARP
ncbi:hypothetical protein JG688_00012642 [Phytophthora aleatoria]|uniref:Uncharacterized protein n=1 Tax=Phytophthora aleatoria TaxID=2496075 RepID=A0A8J5IMX8_9STRA|nr:hypothetical protein JG688_00012642 [Phytophthora aleatoria]